MPKSPPKPSPKLQKLAVLVGTWKLSGDVKGEIRYEWTEGGFFLLQHVDMEYEGRKIKGVEVIGHEQALGKNRSKEILSRYYSFSEGLTLDYEYELNGDVLAIWFGRKGSNNRYLGRIGKGGATLVGVWQWPGGGYRMSATKID